MCIFLIIYLDQILRQMISISLPYTSVYYYRPVGWVTVRGLPGLMVNPVARIPEALTRMHPQKSFGKLCISFFLGALKAYFMQLK